jgi:hypothetical protein
LQLFLGESPEMSTFAGGELYHDGVIRLLFSTFSLAFKQRTGQSVTAWMHEAGG